MRPANIKTIRDRNNLGRRMGRPFLFKLILLCVSAVSLSTLIIYLLFFSGLLEIRSVAITQKVPSVTDTIDKDRILSKINSVLESKKYGYLKTQKNILFFNVSEMKKELLADLLFISQITINKKWPHNLNVGFSLRNIEGIWCFQNDNCRYFDANGVYWGEAVRSSGFLLLAVNDLRDNDNIAEKGTVDIKFMESIKRVNEYFKTLNLKIKSVTIPKETLGEFRVSTDKDYDVIFDNGTDIAGQLEILKILLNERGKDSNFKPQYIDLTIDGRIYLK